MDGDSFLSIAVGRVLLQMSGVATDIQALSKGAPVLLSPVKVRNSRSLVIIPATYVSR